MIFKKFFLIFNKVNLQFIEKNFVKRTHIAKKTLFILKNIKMVNNQGFIAVISNINNKTPIIQIAALIQIIIIPI